ncbi:3-isopropylmalate dehydratase small subunit [Candidatus Bathyarchaeota archaeon]|nr:3-isopropylmalate dehydratase small subunit [Candidatus Bathyarchaeota archaeon]
MRIKGKAWKFGDNINTDYIIPGRYMELTDPEEMEKHVFEEYEPSFRDNVKKGDILVAGDNFGCGSSREHAPLALKYAGIGCVLAESFARIFYRNCINIGLPAMECDNVIERVETGELLLIDVEKGLIINKTKESSFKFKPLPDFMLEILEKGGLTEYIKGIEEW